MRTSTATAPRPRPAGRRTPGARDAGTRHGAAAPTPDPATTWRGRPVDWTRTKASRWPRLVESLPHLDIRPIRNRAGREHMLEGDVVLQWPVRGLFTTRARREWNGASIGSGPAVAPPTQPRAVAEALRQTLGDHRLPAPLHWEAGITPLGEWWMVRGCWPAAPGGEATGDGLMRFIELDHDTRQGLITIGSGLRRPDGAGIWASREGATLTGPVLTGRRPHLTLVHAVWANIDRLRARLAGWRTRRVSAARLAAWARRNIGPLWGPETGPQLLLRNGLSPERAAAPRLDDGRCRTAPDDLSQIAWTLARSLLRIPELDERRELGEEITCVVAELDTWATDRARPELRSEPDRVH